jgi:hypothetical protein
MTIVGRYYSRQCRTLVADGQSGHGNQARNDLTRSSFWPCSEENSRVAVVIAGRVSRTQWLSPHVYRATRTRREKPVAENSVRPGRNAQCDSGADDRTPPEGGRSGDLDVSSRGFKLAVSQLLRGLQVLPSFAYPASSFRYAVTCTSNALS